MRIQRKVAQANQMSNSFALNSEFLLDGRCKWLRKANAHSLLCLLALQSQCE
jgi:hypothetical protein